MVLERISLNEEYSAPEHRVQLCSEKMGNGVTRPNPQLIASPRLNLDTIPTKDGCCEGSDGKG